MWSLFRKPRPPELPVEAMFEEEACEALETRIDAVRAGIGNTLPAYLERERPAEHPAERFRPHQWFDAFPALHPLRHGDVLDFAYHFWGNGGAPKLYFRDRDAPAEVDPNRVGEERWIERLAFEPTPSGFLELAVMSIVAPKFYLHWHSLTDDLECVLTARRRDAIIERVGVSPPNPRGMPKSALLPEEAERLRGRDVRPRVSGTTARASVSFLTFTKWGGFRWRTTVAECPARLVEATEEPVAAYNCWIRY